MSNVLVKAGIRLYCAKSTASERQSKCVVFSEIAMTSQEY